MKPISWVGILLIVLGALALAFQGINYSSKKDLADLGSLHVTATTEHRISLSPVLGGVVVLGGVILVIAGSRKR
jgi:uncharacterized membrane protein